MADEVKLPALGENVAAGDVVDVKVKVGEEVKEGQTLMEVEAEKSTVEVPSPSSGRIAQILIKKGDKVKTGQTLMTIEGKNGRVATPPSKEAAAAPTDTSSPPAQAKAPPEQPPKEVERHAELPQEKEPPSRQETQPAAAPSSAQEAVIPAGPATRRLAREWGIDLLQVSGSGPKGRVTPEDVKGYVKALASGGTDMRVAAPPLPNFERWGPVEYKPFDSVRRKTAERVSLAWATVPHVTHNDNGDVTDIEAFRKQQESQGPKLTVTAFVVKACAILLKQYPQFNASLDMAKEQLVLKHYCHIGVAVDTERGLLVPVLRDVDRKSVHDIGKEIADLAERARLKKISADDMSGGTFTISNLGGIGGTGFNPIINYPQVAILGLSRARLQPVFREGQFIPRLLLPLSLSYDHRVIDGADAARFTRRLAEMLENPLAMLLHA